ncbi:MAG TPA: family 20 glycosylhydrolase [Candidatus Baltobacteraceae bacterium]
MFLGVSSPISVVPQPRQVRVGDGDFVWPSRVRIALSGRVGRNVPEVLRAYLTENGVTAATAGQSAASVALQVANPYDPRLGSEGYALEARSNGVTMRANTERGLFYALQTFEQVSTRSRHRFATRAVTIVDWPAYRWRGIHLDVARHFFSVPVIERYIDVAAHYKLNIFHWHLTDDGAWRLHSDRYPALTGGHRYYSTANVRAVVAYAARRYVTVVPELEMPAHAGAAVRAYPRLACSGETLCTRGAGLAFARGVLADAIAEFPSAYVHTGGDEVPVPALYAQPQFTRDIESYLESRGRRLVGWDDIFTPQLSPRTVVMVWTSQTRGATAARHGNDIVLATGPLYFDGAQGDATQEPPASRHMSTLEEVYDYGVVPAGLSAAEASHVLGGQANVWTEHIATPQHLFYMTLPRELALAEVVWTPRKAKNWNSFLTRLPAQFTWLHAHRYPFRIPNASFALSGGPTIFTAEPGHVQSVDAWTAARAVTVRLSVPLAGAVIHYTTGGARPSRRSHAYEGPFVLRLGRVPVRLRAAAFLRGRAGSVTECTIAASSPAVMRAHWHASASWSALVSP